MLVPVVLKICRDFRMAPSKLLIPLSYFSILGGTATLIGTSTNIIVDEFARTHLGEGNGFGMFDFTPLGTLYAVGGIAFMCLVGWRLLPTREPITLMLPRASKAKFVTELVVEPGSNLEGSEVASIFKTKGSVRLIEIVRNESVTVGMDAADLTLASGDILVIEGSSKDIAEFLTRSGASLGHEAGEDRVVPMSTVELVLGEAVVLPDSPFVGRTVAGLSLNRRYGVKVLAVQRRGQRHIRQIGELRLKPGDVLLLQAGSAGFAALAESQAVLIVEGLEQAVLHKRRGVIAVSIMAGVIVLASLTDLPIAALAVTGAVCMVMTRCLRLDEAMQSLDMSVLLLLAGTIPIGLAMSSTGMSAELVHFVSYLTHDLSPVVQLSLLYLLTNLLTEALSNNATAVFMAPLAVETARHLGVDPRPFLIAVAFASSASFMSPIGYQTNTIVLGPGNYTFSDYLRTGFAMNLITWLLASFLIPVFWPLQG